MQPPSSGVGNKYIESGSNMKTHSNISKTKYKHTATFQREIKSNQIKSNQIKSKYSKGNRDQPLW
jgi:hypothetical protein